MQQHKDERGRGNTPGIPPSTYHQDHIWTISLINFPDNM